MTLLRPDLLRQPIGKAAMARATHNCTESAKEMGMHVLCDFVGECGELGGCTFLEWALDDELRRARAEVFGIAGIEP